MNDRATERKNIPNLIICGGRNPVQFPLTGEVTSVGRIEKNSIQIHRENISYRHLEIRQLPDGGNKIVDLNSSNGTTVNGVSIGECVLSDGDCIVIGRLISVYYLLLPAGGGIDDMEVPGSGELERFQSFHDRLNSLDEQQQLLQQRLREKTAEYQELLDSIVEMKSNPVKALRDIYGEGEVHFPVNFESRFSVPRRTVSEIDDVALSG